MYEVAVRGECVEYSSRISHTGIAGIVSRDGVGSCDDGGDMARARICVRGSSAGGGEAWFTFGVATTNELEEDRQ